MPSVGEQGWGSLVNQNFVLIDQNLPITTNDGSKWLVNNATYNRNTNTWTQTDTNKSSTGVHLTVSGSVELLTCVAGNSVITWSSANFSGGQGTFGELDISGSIDVASLIANSANINSFVADTISTNSLSTNSLSGNNGEFSLNYDFGNIKAVDISTLNTSYSSTTTFTPPNVANGVTKNKFIDISNYNFKFLVSGSATWTWSKVQDSSITLYLCYFINDNYYSLGSNTDGGDINFGNTIIPKNATSLGYVAHNDRTGNRLGTINSMNVTFNIDALPNIVWMKT